MAAARERSKNRFVRPGRKLLIPYNRCGNGGYDSAPDIYAVDAISW